MIKRKRETYLQFLFTYKSGVPEKNRTSDTGLIGENNINNLPNVLHEVRRMYINILNKKTKIEKKYVKKMLLLLKCYLNTKHIFIYGYESVTLEFLKLYNKNCSKNEYSFDIIEVISNLEKYEEDIMNFSEKVLKFIENEEMI